MTKEDDKIKITVIDSTGSKQFPTTVPKSLIIERLIEKFKKELKYPNDAHFALENKRTKTQLNPKDSMAKADVQDGDTLRLRHQGEGGN
ncbi:MAG TPA: EsaB/YukD family protein [Methanothrix sp.]|jgi:sulfur relay (sulfurtransferase) DsrF/TusC family protein|nr:EsaB/YukD family protein [Euryarchaeota archaeon]HON36769.1 EsaB/YukD family protein [Methanothrix sp.]